MTGSTPNQDLSERLKNLSPAQRALLERRLMAKQTSTARQRPLTRREDSGPVPLSHAQELLWLLSQVFDGGVAYNAPGALQLEGPLDLDALERALRELPRRHEILSTAYRVIDGTPMQIVGACPPVELNVIDVGHLEPDAREAEVRRILKHESRFAFDLEHGPVMRPTAIRL